MASRLELQLVPLVLTRPSVVFVQLGSNFLLDGLQVKLRSVSNGVETVGRYGYNIHELDEVVPPGIYNLVVFQSQTPTWLGSGLSHCTRYSLKIIIRDLSSDDHTDCSEYFTVPWDLNRADGGSAPFGGPMDTTGYLHMSGDSFLMAGRSEKIKLSTTKTTLMSLMVSPRASSGSVSAVVTAQSTPNTSLPILGGAATVNNKVQAWSLPAGSYFINLQYSVFGSGCPYYMMDIMADTFDSAEADVLCPDSLDTQLPSHKPQIPIGGYYSETVDTVFPSNVFRTYVNGTEFSYAIAFSINKTSTINVNLAFFSLANLFKMELVKQFLGTSFLVTARSNWEVYDDDNAVANLNAYIAVTAGAGNYTLYIKQSNFTTPFSMSRQQCYPFVYSLEIIPKDKGPSITEVLPTSGVNMNPFKDLILTVTFSDTVYDTANNQIGSGGYLTIKNAFNLTGTDGSSVMPSTARMSVNSNNALKWQLVFDQGVLHEGVTYKLVLLPRLLYNAAAAEFKMYTDHTYAMLSNACSGHGAFANGTCVCYKGYAGLQCEACALGFYSVNSDGVNLCVPRITGNCTASTCGCHETAPSSTCTPIGTCQDSTGAPVCICPPEYDGNSCERCALNYFGYPNCKPKIECSNCVHGTCDFTNGKCVCDSNWAGDHCDKCKSDFSGDNCDKYTPGGVPNSETGSWSSIVAGIVLILVLIGAGVGYFAWQHYRRRQFASYSRVGAGEDFGAELNETALDVNYDSDDGHSNDDWSSRRPRGLAPLSTNPPSSEPAAIVTTTTTTTPATQSLLDDGL